MTNKKPKVYKAKLSDFQQLKDNPNKHTERGLYMLETSMEEVGYIAPMTAASDGVIIDGNARSETAYGKFDDEVIVVESDGKTPIVHKRTDFDSESDKAKIAAIAANRVGEIDLAWDAEVLAQMTEEIDLNAWFKDDELEVILADLDEMDAPEDQGAQIDRAAELQELWQTERGQIWEIPSKTVPGKCHRIMCGDSTSAEDVGRLMDGERAEICFTSPPYLQQRDYKSPIDDWDGLMRGVFANVPELDNTQVLVNLGMVHNNNEWQPYWDGWIEYMRSIGWRRFGLYIWDQLNGLPGDWCGRFAPSFEFIFHFNKKSSSVNKSVKSKMGGKLAKGRTFRKKDGNLREFTHNNVLYQDVKIPDSVVRANRQSGSDGHPAQYSVDFALNVISAFNGRVYDPFLGSGTTLVACEQTARIGYGMEISPAYVAVSLQRLQDLGLEPRRVSDGGQYS